MHKIYEYPKSREYFARAAAVIPSGIRSSGPRRLLYPCRSVPLFSERAEAPISGMSTATASSTICAHTGPTCSATTTPTLTPRRRPAKRAIA